MVRPRKYQASAVLDGQALEVDTFRHYKEEGTDNEQFEKAKSAIEADASYTGRFFGYEGHSCVIGTLYIAAAPDDRGWHFYITLDESEVWNVVHDAYGLTSEETRRLANVNDSHAFTSTRRLDLVDTLIEIWAQYDEGPTH